MRRVAVFFFAVAVVIASVVEDDPEEKEVGVEDDVVIVTTQNYRQFINHSLVLLEYYAPWCHACVDFVPEYGKVAARLKLEDPPIRVGKVDAIAYPDVAAKTKIDHYPTMKLFRWGNMYDFKGEGNNRGRDNRTIVEYMLTQTGEATEEIATLAEVDAAVEKEDEKDVAVMYTRDAKEALPGFFRHVAHILRDTFAFIQTADPEFSTKYNVPSGGVIIFRKDPLIAEDDAVARLSKPFTPDSLTEFLHRERVNTVGYITESNKDLYKFGRGGLAMILQDDKILESDNGLAKAKKIAAEIRELVPAKLRGKLNIGIGVRSEWTSEAERLGISKPGVRAGIDDYARKTKYRMDGTYTAADLKKFFEAFEGKKLTEYIKSAKEPEEQGPVIEVTGNSFKNVVANRKKDVLIELYAPWCGHCKNLAPIYEELGKEYEDSETVTIAKMDGTANDSPAGYESSGYPTIYFAPSSSKFPPKKYEGERTVEAFKEFIGKHGTAKAGTSAARGKEEL